MTIVVKNCSNCLMNEQMANVLFPGRKMWLWLRIGPYFFFPLFVVCLSLCNFSLSVLFSAPFVLQSRGFQKYSIGEHTFYYLVYL